jgi:pyrroloquinoline quinone biosynthesis protein B
VTAYRIEDLASGGVLVHLPRLGRWTRALDELVAGATCVLFDGTRYAADEAATPVRGSRARVSVEHLPVSGRDGSLAALTRHSGVRLAPTPLDHTNPLLDPATDARTAVAGAGVEVLPDGAEFVL